MSSILREPIFVLGTRGCGMRWFAQTLGSHPDIQVDFEAEPLVGWSVAMAVNASRQRELMPKLVGEYVRRFSASISRLHADCNHANIWIAEELKRAFPTARFVGLQRHPYGTIANILRHVNRSPWVDTSRSIAAPNQYLGIDAANADRYGTLPAESQCALMWVSHRRELYRLEEVFGTELLMMEFEHLICDAKRELDRLTTYLRLDAPLPMREVPRDAIDGWKAFLSDEQLENIAAITGCVPPRSEETHLATMNDVRKSPESPIRESVATSASQPRSVLTKWAVGVTAAPREDETIGRTVSSIVAAGLPQPRIFADGDFQLPKGIDATVRTPRIGGWPNFWLALTELVSREPDADAFLIVQDDVVFCKNTYAYLSQFAVPDDCGVVSLFCPACNNQKFGWNPIPVGYGMASGQALAFPRESAFEFLAHPWTVNHRRASPKSKHYRGDGLHHIDGAVGEWCRLVEKKTYCHSPSLSQHIGHTSVMYPGFTGKRDRRFADSFPGESVDANQLFSAFARELAEWIEHGGSEIWSIPAHLWAVIQPGLRPGLRTLELGSGLSTKLFVHCGCNHTSLEHDPEWAERLARFAPACRDALHCCGLTGEPKWYDWQPPAEPFDLILIDGPPGTIGREGVTRVLRHLVHQDTQIFVDDASRRRESELCDTICEQLGWPILRSTAGHNGYARIARPFAEFESEG